VTARMPTYLVTGYCRCRLIYAAFFCGLTKEVHKDSKLVLLSDVPKSILSYYTKWSYLSSPNMQVATTTFDLVAAISLSSTWRNTLLKEVVKGI
jgi:hypothetical protein